jgi:hypothetical protein
VDLPLRVVLLGLLDLLGLLVLLDLLHLVGWLGLLRLGVQKRLGYPLFPQDQ